MSRDLMRTEEIKSLVRDAYRTAAPSGGLIAERLYERRQLGLVPALARAYALGVANHLLHAPIAPGDAVLDIGCGAGIDAILAAHATGPAGRVYALDPLPEMLRRAEAAAAEVGLTSIETVEGEMEAIPLPDASVDWIISNGVLNLSPRKARVLAECARVLRPGGGLCVSDLTVDTDELPPEVLTHPAAWAG